MQKYPKTPKYLTSGIKIFIAAELAALIGSYAIWRRLNHSREFRKEVRDRFPSILEGYYYIGEKLDPTSNIRSLDSAYWENHSKHQH